MNHNDEFGSEMTNLDDELAVYNDAVEFAELLEASSFGTPAAAATRKAGGGVLLRYQFSPPNVSTDEPQASDLAQFVGEHFDAAGLIDVAELWFQAAVVEDGALPTSTARAASPEDDRGIPLLAMFLPLVLAVAMAFLLRSPHYLLFSLLSPVMMSGNWWSER